MHGTPKRQATLEADLDVVLNYLCVEWGHSYWGFSGADIVEEELTADQVACRILAADGSNPENEIEGRRQLRQFFRDRYGEIISAQNYSAG